VSGLKYEKLIKSKPTWKIKHSNYSRVFSGWIEESNCFAWTGILH